MNPRQRRGLFVLALALVAGVATFVAVFRYVALVNSAVGPRTQALVVSTAVEAWQPIPASSLSFVEVPVRWLPDAAVVELEQVVGQVAPAGLASGAYVQEQMIVDPPLIAEGEREFAMLVTAERGVGGQLEPEALVDVVATFEEADDVPASARAVVTGARILLVEPVDDQGEQVVTLALTTEESLDVAYAQSFAVQVRLILVPPGTESSYSAGGVVTAPASAPPPAPAPPAPVTPAPALPVAP